MFGRGAKPGRDRLIVRGFAGGDGDVLDRGCLILGEDFVAMLRCQTIQARRANPSRGGSGCLPPIQEPSPLTTNFVRLAMPCAIVSCPYAADALVIVIPVVIETLPPEAIVEPKLISPEPIAQVP